LKFFVYFPGKHAFLWVIPLVFVISRIIFLNPAFSFGAIISGLFSLYISFQRLIPVRIKEGDLQEIFFQEENKPKKEKISKIFQENLEKSKNSLETEEVKEKLARAQKAEKKAKSELASYDRDLSSMNFRISELEETRKTQEMRISGLRGENELLHKMVKELREEKKQLKEQIMK